MKHLSKFVAITTLLAGSAAAVRAQTVVATIAIQALVNSSLSASSSSALNFGAVVQGNGATVIDPATSAAGRLNIAGSNGQGITINMTTLPSSLTGPGPAIGVSAYTYCYVQLATSQPTCPATAIAQGGQVTGQALSASGQGYLFMGATLAAIPGTQATGTYTGTMTITVTSP